MRAKTFAEYRIRAKAADKKRNKKDLESSIGTG